MARHWITFVLTMAVAGAGHAEDASSEIWAAKCKSCHGSDGKAHTQMGRKEAIVDLTSPDWHKANSDADIRTAIAEGSPRNAKMKGYKRQLTPAQIDALVKYIRGMRKK